MTPEYDLPRGRYNGRAVEAQAMPMSPEVHKERFDQLAGAFTRGELARLNEDGSTTTVVSYQRYIDPMDRNDVTLLSEFRLRAAAAGMREAFSPLMLQTQATLNQALVRRSLSPVQTVRSPWCSWGTRSQPLSRQRLPRGASRDDCLT